MRSAARIFAVGTGKNSKAPFIVFMTIQKRRDQDRCVKERFHRFVPNICRSRSLRTLRMVSSTTDAFNGPVRKTKMPCLL